MSLSGVLVRGRRAAEARMTSRAVVLRQTGGTTTGAGGFEVPEWAAVHVDLPFRLSGGTTSDGGSQGVSVGGVVYERATGVGHLPNSTTDLVDADRILVTSGDGVDEVWEVVAAVRYDQQSARRVPVAESELPEGWV